MTDMFRLKAKFGRLTAPAVAAAAAIAAVCRTLIGR